MNSWLITEPVIVNVDCVPPTRQGWPAAGRQWQKRQRHHECKLAEGF